MKKQKKWIKPRHKVIRNIAYVILRPYIILKYGVSIEKFPNKEKRQFLILLNHQTVFDQFFVGLAINGPIYYLATEDIFSNGFVSKLIKYAVAPIPIKKQTTDPRAVINCIRVAKEGGTIAIAPEGNRTYSGKTEYMNPAIVPLIKKLALPVLTFRIEGGYGIDPRWCNKIRKGKMKAYVSKVIEPEQYKDFTNDELYEIIKNELYVNDAKVSGRYHCNKNAEYMERAIYVCPKCGLSEFESHKDILTCKNCGMSVRYLDTKEFEGIGFDFPFTFVNDWYEYQNNYINNLDLSQYFDKPIYKDYAKISKVIVYKNKIMVYKCANIELFGDRITINGQSYNFDDINAVSVLGRNKLNIYYKDKVYQFKGTKRFNALKYVNIFYRYKNTVKENTNVKFLGL